MINMLLQSLTDRNDFNAEPHDAANSSQLFGTGYSVRGHGAADAGQPCSALAQRLQPIAARKKCFDSRSKPYNSFSQHPEAGRSTWIMPVERVSQAVGISVDATFGKRA